MRKSMNFGVMLVCMIIIFAGGDLLAYGIPLIGLPKIAQVERVEISDARLDVPERVFTDPEDITKATEAVNALRYTFGDAGAQEQFIEITFVMEDGSEKYISVNEESLTWNGKLHRIKGGRGTLFVNAIEGWFFEEELTSLDEED